MRVAILVPVYNERATVAAAVERILATPPPTDPATGDPVERLIVLVDDGSRDESDGLVRELGERPGVLARAHASNQGKGAAVRTALAAALESGADIVLVHDADLEYSPADHAALLAPILDGRADAVIGSRFLGAEHRVLYFWHYAANRFITLLSNMLTNLNLSDVECCMKAMRRELAERVRIREKRFGVEPELVARIARVRLPHDGGVRPARVFEVAVSYSGRTYAEGKKITWRDALSAIRCILRYNLLG